MGTSDEDLVQLTRVLRAPPGKVFAAWTDPALLESWWTGVGGWVDAKADVDLRVGGRYHLSMRDERGALHGIMGIYTLIAPAERLSFTWAWEDEPSVMRGSEGEPRRRHAARGGPRERSYSLRAAVSRASWSRTCTRRAGTTS